MTDIEMTDLEMDLILAKAEIATLKSEKAELEKAVAGNMFTPHPDMVKVVRCKDCKHLYCMSAVDRRFYCRHWPKGLEGINIVEENPYCSYGERKDGVENGH